MVSHPRETTVRASLTSQTASSTAFEHSDEGPESTSVLHEPEVFRPSTLVRSHRVL